MAIYFYLLPDEMEVNQIYIKKMSEKVLTSRK